MKKTALAVVLLFLFSAVTTATISEPIKPVPESAFKYIEPDNVPPLVTPIPIEPLPTPSPKPTPKPTLVKISTKPNKYVIVNGFTHDSNISWYGPGFYGKRTACGFALTKTIKGVANRTLPCGTMVTFRFRGKDGIMRFETVPVIDRGPYVSSRQWDMTGGLCLALHHCFTGDIYYRIEK